MMAEDNSNNGSNGNQNEDGRPIATATLPWDATPEEVAEALRKDRVRRSRS